MALNRIRLGDYIVRSTKNNHNLQYGVDLISGVTSKGVFETPKGNPLDVDLKPYKIVNNGAFVYNPTRLNIGSIAYRTEGLCIVSHLYMVFYLNDEGKKIIEPKYLYIYFRRDEFRREVTFRNFGSQRPEFNYNDMSDIVVPLPDISIQRKYVKIYEAMVANQQSYERGLEDLKLVCDGYIEDLRRKTPCEKIGPYIEQINDTNINNIFSIENVMGVSIEKKFIETKADMKGVDLKPYLIVKPNEFAYVPVTSRNGEKISIAINDSNQTYICSSSYIAFRSRNTELLLPQYLMLFFSRAEFNRYSRFHSIGSARETFDWEEMCNVKIPIPDIKVQKAIAQIYTVYTMHKKINEQLKAQIKDICPILIKGSLEE
jgi:type I restriction enzyme S subunit